MISEQAKSEKSRIAARIVTILNYALGTVATIAALIWILYFVLVWLFGWDNPRVIYWLAMSAGKLNGDLFRGMLLTFAAIVVGYLVLTPLRWRLYGTSQGNRVGVSAILLIIMANVCMCGASWVAVFQTGILGYREHIETANLNDRIYHLHFYSYDPAEGYNDYYYLYECDSLDLLCQRIYTINRTTGGITPDVEQIGLVANDEAQTLSLQVNGEIVYTHRP